jgi:hypothetical protein
MISLLGSPLMDLVENSTTIGAAKWSVAHINDKGKKYWNSHDYYGDPFFNKKKYVAATLIPVIKTHDDFIRQANLSINI